MTNITKKKENIFSSLRFLKILIVIRYKKNLENL